MRTGHDGNGGAAARVETLVVGAGQAGLATAYELARRGRPFLVLDAEARVGDAWRQRWDSLRLFTPARYDGLPGLPFPAPAGAFPTKDEMADYLEAYARRFDLPVRSGSRVQRLSRRGDRFRIVAEGAEFEADNVVVAMGHYQRPRTPAFAEQLGRDVLQLHSAHYRNPGTLRPGPVLLVGAGNSGAEIALDVAPRHRTYLAGRHPGHVPFRIETPLARAVLLPLVLRGVFHHLLTVRHPLGRAARVKFLTRGGPLVRTKPADLRAAGVERVGRITGVREGRPVSEEGTALEVANVIWCTGFEPAFDWIDLPIHGPLGPENKEGTVPGQAGLYFVGLAFLHAASSGMVHGLPRDAERIVRHIERRAKGRAAVPVAPLPGAAA